MDKEQEEEKNIISILQNTSKNKESEKDLNEKIFKELIEEEEKNDSSNKLSDYNNSILGAKSFKDNSAIKECEDFLTEVNKKTQNIIFVENITSKILQEMKTQFKLLIKTQYSEEFYKQIGNEYIAVVGIDSDSNIAACFAVLKFVDKKCVILVFAVVREYQRQGIGTILMEKIIKICKESKKSYIELLVQKSNTSAVLFYLKQNFYTKKVIENYYNFTEEINTALMMKLKLQEPENLKESSFIDKIRDLFLCRTFVNKKNSVLEESSDEEA